MAMAQQRMQQNAAAGVGGAGSMGLPDGSARGPVQVGSTLGSDNQPHPGTQSAASMGSHDGGGSQLQETERGTAADSNMPSGNEQALHQSSSSNDGPQNAMRRNSAMGLVVSAASAFDAAKDIMETLRSKHTNLASELEVVCFVLKYVICLFSYRIPPPISKFSDRTNHCCLFL